MDTMSFGSDIFKFKEKLQKRICFAVVSNICRMIDCVMTPLSKKSEAQILKLQ